jgi:mono/diheme cytochrome c family protein
MEQPVHMGRIYRVVHETSVPPKVEKLSTMSGGQLVEKLRDPNGWVRDTAQRLIVERRDRTVLAQLRAMAADSSGDPRPALHALWTLDGINGLDTKTLDAALHGPPPVVAAAVRLSERFLASQPADQPAGRLLSRLVAIARDAPAPHVRVQCAFTLSAVSHPDATAAVARLLAQSPEDKVLRDAAMSGLAGRELEALELLLKDDAMAAKPAGADATLAALSGAVLREASPQHVERLFTLAGDLRDERQWQQTAVLSGMADIARKAKDAARPPAGVKFAAAPQPFLALSESADAKVADLADAVEPLLHWPGKVDEKQDVAPPLTAAQQKLFDEGKIIFGATCAACHQATGEGLEGKAPPLRGSPWVAGHEGRLIRIVLNGVRGPIHIQDEVINMEMPNLAVLDDRQVASVLTYARREWGHAADPVDPETVAKVRAQVKGRPDAWTEEELLKVK